MYVNPCVVCIFKLHMSPGLSTTKALISVVYYVKPVCSCACVFWLFFSALWIELQISIGKTYRKAGHIIYNRKSTIRLISNVCICTLISEYNLWSLNMDYNNCIAFDIECKNTGCIFVTQFCTASIKYLPHYKVNNIIISAIMPIFYFVLTMQWKVYKNMFSTYPITL